MLWDMARYHNYDIRSPYNRDAALWASNQTTFTFPMDTRPLRDIRVALGRVEEPRPIPLGPPSGAKRFESEPICVLDVEVELPPPIAPTRPPQPEVLFLD